MSLFGCQIFQDLIHAQRVEILFLDLLEQSFHFLILEPYGNRVYGCLKIAHFPEYLQSPVVGLFVGGINFYGSVDLDE